MSVSGKEHFCLEYIIYLNSCVLVGSKHHTDNFTSVLKVGSYHSSQHPQQSTTAKVIWNYFSIIWHANWTEPSETVLFEIYVDLSDIINTSHHLSKPFITCVSKSRNSYATNMRVFFVVVTNPFSQVNVLPVDNTSVPFTIVRKQYSFIQINVFLGRFFPVHQESSFRQVTHFDQLIWSKTTALQL